MNINNENFGEANWINWTQGDWIKWVKNKLEERKKIYKISPDELIASYNREKSKEKEYHGRELLELIQNADDAGHDCSDGNKIKIKLKENALYIANTGMPFSPEGISSLMISDISPKQVQGLKYIGYKGLGFRSILGWASTIAILSGNSSIGFSKELAYKWLEDLKSDSTDVRKKVNDFSTRTGIKRPVAILVVPFPIESKTEDTKLQSFIEYGEKLVDDGYDTVVCILFSSPEKLFDQVREQIDSLVSETLLFLNNIVLMEIEYPGKFKKWRVERDKNILMITPDDEEPQIWNLYTDKDVIPKEYLSSDQIDNNKYEIKIAIPTIHSNSLERLFVYFPTKVSFPFPIIAHATFELTGNRQNLIESEVNEYITDKLLNLMAQSATKITNKNDPWFALKSFIPHLYSIHPDLEEYDFTKKLIRELQNIPIIPLINGEFASAKKAKRLRGNFNQLLQRKHFKNHFQDICLYPPEEYLLDKLDIDELDYGKFKNRLNKITKNLIIEERADLIYLLCKNYNLVNESTPDLLLDDKGEIILPGITPILPPEEQQFNLPSWVRQRFIDSKLISLLKEKFQVSRIRDLASKLSIFNIQEYNIKTLISSIVATTNQRVESNPDNEMVLRKEMVQAIWNLYISMDEDTAFPKNITIKIPTRKGECKPTDELYFGKEYYKGQLLEYLYKNVDEYSFVASPKILGFKDKQDKIEDFLCWLGVADKPKYINEEINDSKFKEFVVSKLKKPIQFEEFVVYEEDLNERPWKIQNEIKNVLNIDRFVKVLEKADPHAIICWIASEPNIDNWRLYGDSKAILKYYQGGNYKLRQLKKQSIISYPLWLLSTSPWLITEDGSKKTPLSCSISKNAKDLSPIIGYPAINLDHELIKELGFDKTTIVTALTRIGITSDLDELQWDQFYDLLLNLPNIDPTGKKTRTLYRTLVSRNKIDSHPPMGEKYQQFLEKGKMLGKKMGEIKYYPINQLYYVENNIIPDNILEHYPLVEIDRRRGVQKVEKLFGIQQLTADKIHMKISEFKEHPLNKNFESDIQRVKPYIYALRVEEDANQSELKRLKRIKIILCKSLVGTFIVDNKTVEIPLKTGKSFYDGDTAYLVFETPDLDTKILGDELLANAIGEIITTVFRVDKSSDIARIVSCSSIRRDGLLDLIVGGVGNDRLKNAKEALNMVLEDEIEFIPPSASSTSVSEITESKELVSDEHTIAEKKSDESKNKYPDEVMEVEAIEDEHIPIEERTIIKRIRINSKASQSVTPRKISNPNRAENLAMKFEESQNRYPLKVSHLQGIETFGCDIISFKLEQDKLQFEKTSNIGLIERFIEVKGSSSAKGAIILKGNQLNSAQKYKEKYYLYRVYEDTPGVFDLIELYDPLDEDIAGKYQYEVNPYQSKKSKRWDVMEIRNTKENIE